MLQQGGRRVGKDFGANSGSDEGGGKESGGSCQCEDCCAQAAAWCQWKAYKGELNWFYDFDLWLSQLCFFEFCVL